MALIWVVVGSAIIIFVLLVLWLRARRQSEIEYIAYGLRASEDDENTRANITEMESGFVEALNKLEELGEVQQDNWGQWVWTKTGKPVGSNRKNK